MNELTLECGTGDLFMSYQISDLEGRIAVEGAILVTETKIDCRGLTPGMYVLRTANSRQMRFVKQ